MRALLRLIVLLVVLAAVAEFGGRYVAEQVVAGELQSSQHLSSKPAVSIGGFPFLAEFASGRYDRVTATADDVPVGTTSLRLSRVRLQFHDVTASRDFKRFTARTATANARLSYADLGRTLDADIAFGGDGRIRATKTFTVLGKQVRPTITVRPRLVNDVLTFTGASVNGVQDLPASVRSALERVFTQRLRLTGLPFDVRVTGVRVTNAGITLALAGTDLRYAVRGSG